MKIKDIKKSNKICFIGNPDDPDVADLQSVPLHLLIITLKKLKNNKIVVAFLYL